MHWFVLLVARRVLRDIEHVTPANESNQLSAKRTGMARQAQPA
jgi:hypothetical protein